MTSPSQGLNQADQQQTTGDPEAWSGQRSRKLLRGPAVPAVSQSLICSHLVSQTRHTASRFQYLFMGVVSLEGLQLMLKDIK